MTTRTKLMVAVLWIVSLAAAGVMAQPRPPVATQSQSAAHPGEREVLAGPDIGFRVDHSRGDTPVGELVVKKDGKWVPIEFDARMKMVK
jgi:hypothetical protein